MRKMTAIMNLAAAAALAGVLLTGCSTEADETTTAAATTAAEAETTTAAGGAAETTEGGALAGKKISVMTPYLTSVTTNQMAGYIKEDLEAEGAEVFVIDTANDFAELASRIEDVVSSGTDGIVLVSADPNQVANQLQDAFDADIPVFGCDSGFIDGMQINATSDNYQMGELIVRYLFDDLMGGKGTVIALTHRPHPGVVKRCEAFDDIIKEAEQDLRDLMNIPDNYKVLFLQGGASQFFAEVPMNLMKNRKAGYILTGQWAKKAFQEAKIYGEAVELASSADETFSYIPDCSDLPITDDMDYVYICENNTIYGTKYKKLPNTKGRILVSDVSSCFLSEPMDVTNYGVVYGGVQKNIGPAGVVIAIIREDLITDDVLPGTPTMLKWKTQADNDSLYNTPPCYNIYICGKVFKWLKKMGGLSVMKERNEEKAKILYDFLDQSRLFKGTVRKEDRSLMNVPFVTGNEELDAKFVKEAAAAGFVNLKGHRTVGGMRASIYNAMPKEGVEKLVEFMKKFEEENA